MTDEKIIELLMKIKEYCKLHNSCLGCPFMNGKCQIRTLAQELNSHPHLWDMEEIERIIHL